MMTQEEEYIEALYPPDPQLEHVKESLREQGVHDISVAPGYGRLLTLLVRLSGAKAALEIGALGGYSGICIARGLAEGGSLCSLELEPEFARLAQRNLDFAGLGEKAEFRTGEALDRMKELLAEGRRFDFIFIDADKGNYPDYLELAVALSNPGGLIAADNLFLRGKTFKETSQGRSATRVRLFNRLIANDSRLESAVLPAFDGFAIARVK
jgi:predicted O-methyltransferase YrrM